MFPEWHHAVPESAYIVLQNTRHTQNISYALPGIPPVPPDYRPMGICLEKYHFDFSSKSSKFKSVVLLFLMTFCVYVQLDMRVVLDW